MPRRATSGKRMAGKLIGVREKKIISFSSRILKYSRQETNLNVSISRLETFEKALGLSLWCGCPPLPLLRPLGQWFRSILEKALLSTLPPSFP